jgi:hypothetical protein
MRREATLLAATASVLGYLSPASAQLMPGLASSGAPAPPPLPKNPSDGANLAISQGGLTDFFSARTPYEFWLTCLIVLFGLIMTFLFLIHVRRIDSRRTEDVARPIIVITLIVGTLILITAG